MNNNRKTTPVNYIEVKVPDLRQKNAMTDRERPSSASTISLGTVVGTTLQGGKITNVVVNPAPKAQRRPSTSNGTSTKRRTTECYYLLMTLFYYYCYNIRSSTEKNKLPL